MDKWNGLVAVVTGASAGIGKATAIKLAQEGMIVAALARRMDRLQELSNTFKGKGKIRGYKCDIGKDNEVVDTFRKIEEELGQVRVLINNAGIVFVDRVSDINLDKWRQVFDVNFFGLFCCTKQVLKSAEKNGDKGLVHIVNINSVGGHYDIHLPEGIDACYIYECTKRNLITMGRALYRELAKDKRNIKITSVSPGSVATEMGVASGFDDVLDFGDYPILQSEEVADAILTQLAAPENVLMSEIIIQPTGETI